MTQRCERIDLPRGTGEMAAWAVIAALATGCCATHSIDEGGAASGRLAGRASVAVSAGAAQERDVAIEFSVITGDEAAARLWPEPAPVAYAAPDQAQSEALAELVRLLFAESAASSSGALSAAAARAGFTVQGWEVLGRRYLAATEEAGRRGGGGAYVVRVGASTGTPVILQAPHAFHDLGTERIALELLFAGEAWPRALFVNTVHRYLGPDGTRRRQAASPADPCHSPHHLFAVATAAALDVLPRAEVVQLHGFGDDPDETEAEAGVAQPEMIVSGGRAALATPRSQVVADRLRAELGARVALFPVDISRLGATTNVQGRAILARGAAEFIHIEMSRTLREQLRRDPAARARLAAALQPDPMPGIVSP
jgi:hypothetical protein